MNTLRTSSSTLSNVRAYLKSKGWSKVAHPNTRIELFESPKDDTGDYASASLPKSLESQDSIKLLNEAISLISEYDNVQSDIIVNKIYCWDRDILRTRIFTIGENDNSLPLKSMADVLKGLREFLGSAAYTEVRPRPFFIRSGAASSNFTEHCLFGHTFKGSFGLTVESPILTPIQMPLDGFDDPPLERKIFDRVAIGLDSLNRGMQKNSINPIVEEYSKGLNSNMCWALSQIYEYADGRTIEYDISWSPQIKSSIESTWRPLRFDSRAYQFTKLAAEYLERVDNDPEEIRIEGRITILKSDTAPGEEEQEQFEHIITISWDRDSHPGSKISVVLSPEEYLNACDAHKYGKLVSVYGKPLKPGRVWILDSPRDFSVIN